MGKPGMMARDRDFYLTEMVMDGRDGGDDWNIEFRLPT